MQCHRCNGWGHYKQQCPSEEPAEGSKEWANLNGEEMKRGESPSPGSANQPPTIIHKMGSAGGSLKEMLKMPEYHNPDPLVRLIGDANEAPAIV